MVVNAPYFDASIEMATYKLVVVIGKGQVYLIKRILILVRFA